MLELIFSNVKFLPTIFLLVFHSLLKLRALWRLSEGFMRKKNIEACYSFISFWDTSEYKKKGWIIICSRREPYRDGLF